MNKSKILGAAILFAVTLVIPMVGFGVSGQEVIARIDDNSFAAGYVDAKQTMSFSKPGDKVLIIKNHSSKDIKLGRLYFVGDEFTSPLVASDFSIRGRSGCLDINAGCSCSIKIVADEKATPTLNPGGLPLLLSYSVKGEKESKFIRFKVSSNYNDYLRFKVRNVEFTKKKAQVKNAGDWFEGELTITNKDPKNTIRIWDVKLKNHGKDLGKVYYKNIESCRDLKEGAVCQVALYVDDKTLLQGNSGVLPIRVKYDVISEDAKGVKRVVKDKLVGMAAAVFKSYETQVGRSVFGGFFVYGNFKFDSGVYKLATKLSERCAKPLVVTALKNSVVKASTIGALDGVAFLTIDKVLEGVDKVGGFDNYNLKSTINSWIAATTRYSITGLVGCFSLDYVSYLRCFLPAVGCRLASRYITNFLEDKIFESVVYRLPEQNSWLSGDWSNAKLMFNFAFMAFLKATCQHYLGSSDSSFLGNVGGEVCSDIVSASTMIGAGPLFNNDNPTLPTNGSLFVDDKDDYCGEECVCSERKEIRLDIDDL